jgi:uncharacterized membrane protein
VTTPPPPPGGYPPPQQPGYPPQQPGYPPQQPGYPPQQPGYPPQQPGYPPQQPGYPPQQPGGYPPPPQPGYPPPPPPPPAGYPPPSGGYPPPDQPVFPPQQQPGYPPQQLPGATREVNIGEAFGWAWNKFSKNAVTLIVPAVAYGLIIAIIGALVFFLAGLVAPDYTSSYGDYGASFAFSFGFLSMVVFFLGLIVIAILGGAFQSAYLGGLLDIADGKPVEIGTFFKPRNVVNVVIASAIIGVASAIGSIVFIGSAVVALFTLFAVVILVERNGAAIEGIKASFEMVKGNFVQALLTYLMVAVIGSIGVIVCFVGLLVSGPVAALYLVYAYRTLSGGQVAPLTP